MATYYSQRASAGLLITEATAISHQGQGYADVPGLYAPEQVEGWKQVTQAVHAAGGKVVVQLWHVGRVSHTDLQPGGAAPVAPSAIAAKTKTVLLKDGAPVFVPTSTPRALDADELPDAWEIGYFGNLTTADGAGDFGRITSEMDQLFRPQREQLHGRRLLARFDEGWS